MHPSKQHVVTLPTGGRAYVDIQKIRETPAFREEVSERLQKIMAENAADIVALLGPDEGIRELREIMKEMIDELRKEEN